MRFSRTNVCVFKGMIFLKHIHVVSISVNMTFMMFPSPCAARSQLTSCWSMLRHIRNTCPLVELVTSKRPRHKSLHTMCQRNWNCHHQKSTFVGIRHHPLTTNCCRSVLTKPPFPATHFTAPTVRWYIRDRGAMPNRNHGDKKLLPLTTRRVVRLNKTTGKESAADAKVTEIIVLYYACEEDCRKGKFHVISLLLNRHATMYVCHKICFFIFVPLLCGINICVHPWIPCHGACTLPPQTVNSP